MKKSIVMMAVVVVLACACDVRAWSEDFEAYPNGLLTAAPWDEGNPAVGGGQVVTSGAGYTGKGLVGSGLGNIWRAADTDPTANVLTARLYSADANFSRYYFGFHTEAITDGAGFPGSDAVVIYMMWHTDGGWLSFESSDFTAGVFQANDTEWTGQSIGLPSNTWFDVRMTLNGDDTVSGEYKLTTSDTWIPIGDGSVNILDPAEFAPNFVGVAGQESGRVDDIVNGPPTPPCNDAGKGWGEGFESYPDGLLTSAPWDEGSLVDLGTEQLVTSGVGYTGKGLTGANLGYSWRATATDLCTNVLTARLYSEPVSYSRYYFGFHTEAIQDGTGFPASDAVVIYMAWHPDGGWLSFESSDFNAGVFNGNDTEWTGQAIGLLSNTWYDARLTLNLDDTASGEYKLTTSDTWLPIGDGSVNILDPAEFAPNFVGVAGMNSARVDDIFNGTPPSGTLILVQ